MLENRELFQRDPTTFTIPNDGVAKVYDPRTDNDWEVLRYELQSFVCKGEYQEGMERVLGSYLANLDKTSQPAVWVSGFYGSGKSHFVRVLEYLWRNVEFPDGAEARSLVALPKEIQAQFRELSTAGKREGGLWSAAGTLSAGTGSVRLALLSILFRSAGLPGQYAPARFVIRLKQKGHFDQVRAAVERAGGNLQEELSNMYVSPVLAKALLEAEPDLGSVNDVLQSLRAQYPRVDDIDDEEMLQTMTSVLQLQSDTPGKIPCTLVIFDELQQFIGDDSDRTLQVQHAVEACTARFGSLLLFVATGQAALAASPQLSKLKDRFTVPVTLSDRDVERVVREVVLRKTQDKIAPLKRLLDDASGEIDRHLNGSRIAATQADKNDLVPDYPLLPTRRRFWERTLRAIDRAGTAAQLRTQLRVVHEATRQLAREPVGTVVAGDVLYDQQKAPMLQSGVLLRDIDATIQEQNDGTEEGRLRSRLCATIFLVGQLPRDGAAAAGIRATADTLADLLVEDLRAGSAALRQRIPLLLEAMVQNSTLMKVEGEYRLQTRESAEWEQDFRTRYARIAADDSRIASDRTTAFRNAINEALKGVKITQGVTKTPRAFDMHFSPDAPPVDSARVPVWVRDGWAVSERTVRDEAVAAGTENPTVFVLLPRQEVDALRSALAGHAAAQETLDARAALHTNPEAIEARNAMQTRLDTEASKVNALVAGVLQNARVFQGGGSEIAEGSLPASVESAIRASLVRLFPRFEMADQMSWGTVVKRAQEGAADTLRTVGYDGNTDQHPICREILEFVGGSGRKGSDIRKCFEGTGFGWPRDAVDGALLALVAGGFVRASRNRQPLTATDIPQGQIGVTDFQKEGVTVSTAQKIGLRKFMQDVGIAVSSGEEAAKLPDVLRRLHELAGEAGGAPPLPERPSAEPIERLMAEAGNEQLAAVYKQRDQLLDNFQDWSRARDLIEERQPRWRALQRLLHHARELPDEATTRPQVEAIQNERSLLVDPDPVSPLIDRLTRALRAALQERRQQLHETYQREMEALEASEEWRKLDEEQRQRLLASNNMSDAPPLSVGTEEALLRSLDEMPLSSWDARIAALPGRARQARLDAAKLLEPQAVRVRPNPATLRSEADAEAYLEALRDEIMRHIREGSPVML